MNFQISTRKDEATIRQGLASVIWTLPSLRPKGCLSTITSYPNKHQQVCIFYLCRQCRLQISQDPVSSPKQSFLISHHPSIHKLCWIGHLQCKFCIFCPLAWLKFNPKPPFESSLALSLSESGDNMMWSQPRASYIWKLGRLLVISWPSTVSATPYDLSDAVTVWEMLQSLPLHILPGSMQSQ